MTTKQKGVTKQDIVILKYFLGNMNTPTYAKKISDDLRKKRGENVISRDWARERCIYLKKQGFLDCIFDKPPYQKESEFWFIKKDLPTFIKVANIFITTGFHNQRDGFVFIYSDFARQFLNENLIRYLLWKGGFYMRREYNYLDFSDNELRIYTEILEREVKIHPFRPGTINIKDMPEEQRKYPGMSFTPYPSITVMFPILPKDVSEEERKRSVLQVNGQAKYQGTPSPDTISNAKMKFIEFLCEHMDVKSSLFHKFYEFEEGNYLKDILTGILCLIQNSPTALGQLFLQIRILKNCPSDQYKGKEIVGPGGILVGGLILSDTLRYVLRALIFSALFDMSTAAPKIIRTPQNSIVDKIDVLSESGLVFTLNDGRIIKYDFSMTISKDGITSISDGSITITKMPPSKTKT